jgi:hypothetical protein
MTAWQRFRSFFTSPHHAWLGALTVGAGLASADIRYATAGVAAYLLGWIYLPDTPLFRNWVGRREDAARAREEAGIAVNFQQRQKELYASLTKTRQIAYDTLAHIGRDIEKALQRGAGGDAPEELQPQLLQIDRLMWTYLKLLRMDQDQQELIQREQREDVPGMLREAAADLKELEEELAGLNAATDANRWEAVNRLCNSKRDRLDVLRRRALGLEKAENDLQLTLSEQDRLVDLFKLMRSEVNNVRDASEMTPDISASARRVADDLGGWSPPD